MGRYLIDPYAQASPLTDMITTIGKAMMTGPTAAETANQQARAEHAGLESEKLRRGFRGQDAVANYARGGKYDPAGFATALADSIGGGRSGEDVGAMMRALGFNMPGAPQPVRDSAFLGAGGSAQNTETGAKNTLDNAITRTGMEQGGADRRNAATIASHEKIANMQDERSVINMVGPNGAFPMTKRDAVARGPMGAYPVALPASSYAQSPDGSGGFTLKLAAPGVSVAGPHPMKPFAMTDPQSGVSYGSNDGRTTLDGRPIPGTAVPTTFQMPEIGKSEQQKLADKGTSLGLLKGTLADVRGLATPDRMGATGLARRTVQDAIVQGGALGNWLGFNTDQLQTQLKGVNPGLAQTFDKGAEELDTLANILAYRAAAAVGEQRGQGASDKDIARWRAVIGDAGLLANPQGLNARLDALEREIEREISGVQTQGGRQGGSPRLNPAPPIGVGAPAPAPAGGAPRVPRYNPQTRTIE